MRIITWNVRKASDTSTSWDYLRELDPDIALIQDARLIPDSIRDVYAIARDQTAYYPGSRQQHLSAILAKGEIGPFRPLPAPNAWMREALAEWREYFTARRVTLASGAVVNVMSVYSLANPVPAYHWEGKNTGGIQLPGNDHIWATELMWSTLKMMPNLKTEPWVVGGDLNSSILFDKPKPRGNRVILERMADIGLPTIPLSDAAEYVPTFRHSTAGLIHQLDHIFANDLLSEYLVDIRLGDTERVFGGEKMLSDHLPIIVDFDPS